MPGLQTMATALGPRPPSWLLLLLVVAVGVGFEVRRRQRERAVAASLGRLVERYPGWHRQAWPAGITLDLLAGRFAATARGDRRYGIEHAIGGPLQLQLGGTVATCQVACFRWWYEQGRRRTGSGRGRSTGYERREEVLVLCQLPVHAHRSIRVLPADVLDRIGLTRDGTQVESDAFNRAFEVQGSDPTLTITLLDAGIQELLAEAYRGRGIEISDDLLVLSGAPSHRDRSLVGIAQTYPAIVQDLARLLRSVPAAFWRQLDLSEEVPLQPEGGARRDEER
ncbi:MAG: hypothetical protein ACLFS9_11740 [Nitriliruptoraceae bacterium]